MFGGQRNIHTQEIIKKNKLTKGEIIMSEEIKNVFVSHFHKDEENIDKLKKLLSDDLVLRNYSVTTGKFNEAEDENYIKYEYLKPLITQSSVVICLIGPETHNSEWVDWEIREAEKLGKPIIGVYIQGAKESDIPPALNELADSIVGWNTDSIVDAINGKSSFVNADGSPRASVTTGRVVC